MPGNHCGSTALRNLLDHHGIPISEELAFGLGAGACFYYLPADEQLALALHATAAPAGSRSASSS